MDANPQAYISRLLSYVGDDDPWAILAETSSRLAALLARADASTRSARPEPSHWSINEIVAHLADSEVVAAYRIRMILALDGTPIQAFDQNRWAAAFDYAACDADESLELFTANRRATLKLLRRVPAEALDHHGMHAERGVETVHHLVRLYAGHDRNHLSQLEGIVSRRADVS